MTTPDPLDWDSPRPTWEQIDAATDALMPFLSPEDQKRCKTDVALSSTARAKRRTLALWFAVACREYVETTGR